MPEEQKNEKEELSAEDLKQVTGGSDTVTVNKAKVASKAAERLDEFLRS